jgi:hypothetical protein
MRKYLLLISVILAFNTINAQDSTTYKLKLSFSVLDFPQNFQSEAKYPSMMQSVELSNDLYDLSFWGIDALGNLIIRNKKNTLGCKIANSGVKYVLGFVFSKYGSELPIPLGVYNHEEFHRSVLGVNDQSSLNGNWIFNRWDGTVYGLTDENLTELKQDNLDALLYSYVSGVQSENYLTQVNVIQDFYDHRTFYKNPFYLYNAYYVWDYFHFSTGPDSDSVKVLAPENEDPDPYYRDYAGADLTAWIYDMFDPESPYTNRDQFPEGEGVNRRIGFSDLTDEGQDFLEKQKNLSLLNFVNPAIFFFNRININEDFSFLLFMQYSPTHFGNDVAVFLPFKIKSFNQLVALHNYKNHEKGFFGLQYGLYDLKPFSNKNIDLGATLNLWSQPENQSFYDDQGKFGGALELQGKYALGKGFSAALSASYKSLGWMIGNPYLEEKFNFRIGVRYDLVDNRRL